jgi:hypothetical protein
MRLPRPAALLLLALSPLLPACGLFPAGVSCTDEALPSVVVTVEDEGGNPVSDARVTYMHDGGAEQQAQCRPFLGSSDLSRCGSWVAGEELAGQFTLTATSADGTRRAEHQVSVSEDECHVVPAQVRLTLR